MIAATQEVTWRRSTSPQREARKAHRLGIEEVVMDKGHHSGAVLVNLAQREFLQLCAGTGAKCKRHWPGRNGRTTLCVRESAAGAGRAVQAIAETARRTMRTKFRAPLKRPACHAAHVCTRRGLMCSSGCLVQAAAFNIGLLLRTLSGWGKPRQSQGRLNPLQALLFAVFAFYDVCRTVWDWLGRLRSQLSQELSALRRPGEVGLP